VAGSAPRSEALSLYLAADAICRDAERIWATDLEATHPRTRRALHALSVAYLIRELAAAGLH
jgi:hypothetical protein